MGACEMATPISTRQLPRNHDTSPFPSDEFVYSFTDAHSSPRSSFESGHPPERSHDLTEFNMIAAPNSQHLKTRNRDDETTNAQRLRSELRTLQEQSYRQSREYERAIRRALLENEYVRKINAKLVAKLESLTREEENTKTSLKRLEAVAQCSKDLMAELGDGKTSAEERAFELEGRNRQLTRELEITADVSTKEQMEMDAILSEIREKDAKLKKLESEGHETDVVVMELRDSLLTSSHTCNKLRIELNTVIGERENARLRVEELLMEKDDDVLRRLNAEAALAKAKRELNELRQRHDTFAVAQKDMSLQDEGKNGKVMLLDRKKDALQRHVDSRRNDSADGESTWEIVTTAVEQYTSERAGELEEGEKEKKDLWTEFQSEMEEGAKWEAKMESITTAIEKTPPGDALDAEDEAIQYASKIDELTAENADLREQVETLKDELQDLSKNSRAVTDVTNDRDMLALKLKNITAENEASDLLVLTMTKQIGTLNWDLNHLSTTSKATRLELMAAQGEVSAMKNELILTKDILEKANAMVTTLRCQLTSTNEALDSMTLKFKAATDEIDLLKDCIDDFSGILKSAEPRSGENDGCCRGASDSNHVSSDDAKLESLSDSTEQEGNQNYHISVLKAMNSVVQSLQSENNDLLTSLACAKNEMKEECKDLSKLESENNGLKKSTQYLVKELGKAFIKKCDHVQLQVDQAFDAAERKISFLNTRLLQKMKDREELDNVVSSLEREKEDALAHISDLEIQLCKTIESASVQQKELQERVRLLELDRKSIFAHNEGLTSELKNSMDKVASLEQSSREEKKLSESLKNQLRNLKVMLEESTVLASKRSKETILLQEHNAKFHEKLERQMSKEKELCGTIKLLKKERDDYKLDLLTTSDQVKLLTADIACLHEQAKTQNDEIALLRSQKNHAEAHVKDYECSVRSLCLSYGLIQLSGHSFDEMLVVLESERSKQRERTNSMEMELEAVQDENAILEQQVHILSKEVSKCNRENRELSAAIAELRKP